MMNLTDQALLLFRELTREHMDAPSPRLAHVKYRAYRRWKRRQGRQAGLITPASIWAQQLGAASDGRATP